MRNAVMKSALFAAALFAGPAIADTPTAPAYTVVLKLHDGETLVASPTLRVEAGTATRFTSGGGKGPSYSLRFTVRPVDKGLIEIDTSYDVVLASGRHLTGMPRLTTRLNQEVAMRTGDEHDSIQLGFTLAETKPAD
jgi:hypothetical protein